MNQPKQASRAKTFFDLHHHPGAFVIPNPWSPGTARILEGATDDPASFIQHVEHRRGPTLPPSQQEVAMHVEDETRA